MGNIKDFKEGHRHIATGGQRPPILFYNCFSFVFILGSSLEEHSKAAVNNQRAAIGQ